MKKIEEMFNKDLEGLKKKWTGEQYSNWNEKYTRRNQYENN